MSRSSLSFQLADLLSLLIFNIYNKSNYLLQLPKTAKGDRPKGDTEDLNNDIIVIKEDVNGESESLQKVKCDYIFSMVQRH